MNIKVKTHLIITDIHNEYSIKWCGKLMDSKPLIKNNLPVFIIIGYNSRIELNTANIKELENCAKRLTFPRGKEAITTDKSYIYLKEESGNEKLVCIVTCNKVKTFAPMFDEVGYY